MSLQRQQPSDQLTSNELDAETRSVRAHDGWPSSGLVSLSQSRLQSVWTVVRRYSRVVLHAYLLSVCFFLSISLGAIFFVILTAPDGCPMERRHATSRRDADHSDPVLALLMLADRRADALWKSYNCTSGTSTLAAIPTS